MHKLGTAVSILLTAFLLAGCGEDKAPEVMENETMSLTAIVVQKDGSIIETITEDFSKDYYNEDNLRSMVLGEVADYNNGSEEGNISVDKFESENGMIVVQMKYPSPEAYKEYNTNQYNDNSFFYGTVAQAYDSGYSVDVLLTDIKGEETIGKEELLDMGESRILITDTPMRVKLPGRIKYAGEHVTVVDKNQALMQADENGEAQGPYYIVFK